MLPPSWISHCRTSDGKGAAQTWVCSMPQDISPRRAFSSKWTVALDSSRRTESWGRGSGFLWRRERSTSRKSSSSPTVFRRRTKQPRCQNRSTRFKDCCIRSPSAPLSTACRTWPSHSLSGRETSSTSRTWSSTVPPGSRRSTARGWSRLRIPPTGLTRYSTLGHFAPLPHSTLPLPCHSTLGHLAPPPLPWRPPPLPSTRTSHSWKGRARLRLRVPWMQVSRNFSPA
mmetsp:Transcript_7797/g.18774  ORF Transcript_7797/g.18774 Transcript_7797/m.18774 type:complete len:228 (+) Transcript_7797:631-1314(+)